MRLYGLCEQRSRRETRGVNLRAYRGCRNSFRYFS